MDLPLHLREGTLIVFEGPDGTGKSTQLERFERACHAPQDGAPLYEPTPMFTHQPSGATGLGPDIYTLTESVDWSVGQPLTRQLLHLAAHAEHYANDIIPALEKSAVFMDRCWWSTVAYGWSDKFGRTYGFAYQDFVALAQAPTQGVMPDVVFLFLARHDEKKLSRADSRVHDHYLDLSLEYAEQCVIVPNRSVGETTAFISGELHKRGLVK